MALDAVRDEIQRLARDAGTEMESRDRAHLREHLEHATGLKIAELAEVTKQWPT
jgi:mannitol-1-phosphate/altronate dehydrogenase